MSAPALVVGRFLDVLAWNPLAGALLGDFTELPGTERNLLVLFLHPQADQACPDRAATVAELTAMLRAQVAAEPGHPRAVELVGELAARSAEFPSCGPATTSRKRPAAGCASTTRWSAS